MNKPEIIIIAAVAEGNRVIGDGLKLPWHIPADLRRFKALTTGHPLIMGRRTFESLVHQFGGALKDRTNVVLTSNPEALESLIGPRDDVVVYASLEEALDAFQDREKIYIGGGAKVYESAMDITDVFELTIVHGDFEGDTFFPPYTNLLKDEFILESSDPFPRKNNNVPGFTFETWRRND